MTLFEKICRMVGDRRIPSFRMPAFRLFRVGFANKHVTTIVVLAIIVSGLAVAVGLYFAVKDVASSTYNWPEPAEYDVTLDGFCLLYTSPSPRDRQKSRMPSSA